MDFGMSQNQGQGSGSLFSGYVDRVCTDMYVRWPSSHALAVRVTASLSSVMTYLAQGRRSVRVVTTTQDSGARRIPLKRATLTAFTPHASSVCACVGQVSSSRL